MTYSEKLQDPRWQKKRLLILQRDNFTCTECGDTKSTLHVHHEEYNGQPWDISNELLSTLCNSCHELKHTPIITLSTNNKNINARYLSSHQSDLRNQDEDIFLAFKNIIDNKSKITNDEYKELKINLNNLCISKNIVLVDFGITYGLQNG